MSEIRVRNDCPNTAASYRYRDAQTFVGATPHRGVEETGEFWTGGSSVSVTPDRCGVTMTSGRSAMGIFNRRLGPVDHQYTSLRINGWYEMRVFDPRTTKADIDLWMAWIQRISDFTEDQWSRALVESDDLLRALIPAVVGLEGTADPDRLAFDFVHGWLLAGIEQADGHARHESASMAALMALSLLRMSMAKDGSIARDNLLEAGYFARRMALNPDSLVGLVIAGANRK